MNPFPKFCPITITQCINGYVVSRADVPAEGVRDVMVFNEQYELSRFLREHFTIGEE